jgi:hypothetical protein
MNMPTSAVDSIAAEALSGARGVRPALLVRRVPFRGPPFVAGLDRDMLRWPERGTETHPRAAAMRAACGDDDLMSEAQ